MRYLRRRRYVRISSVGFHRLTHHGHNFGAMFKERPALHGTVVPRDKSDVFCNICGHGSCSINSSVHGT